jgi:uncharacterized protein
VRWICAVWLIFLSVGAHATSRPISFESEGASLHGCIVMPQDGNATAGIVLVHGSGPDGAADYLSQTEAFARDGIAALVYDKRGWNRSG